MTQATVLKINREKKQLDLLSKYFFNYFTVG
jgi:hypothetical protein